MNLDFLEIGTSEFETEIQKATDHTVGISVEPLKHYLDKLPNPDNVIKENVAISFDDTESEIEIYHIPPDVIKERGLSIHLRGTNSIGKYHFQHERQGLKDIVQIDKVKQIPISKLLQKHNVHEIKYLKIDTEGGDCFILKNLKKYLEQKDKSYYPKRIQFESNRLTPKELVEETKEEYAELGYEVHKITVHNTILVLK
jgi:FkbM family methyltransferase